MEYIAQSDLNEDTLQYEVNMNDPSYITWITSGAGGSFEDSSEWYEEDTNEYTTTALQEGAFTNDNQNYYDKILAASAGYNTSNITNECFTVPSSQNTRSFSRNPNIKKSTEKYIVNETSDEKIPQDRNNLDVYSRTPESYTPEEEPQGSITEPNNNMPQLSNMLEKDDITVEDPNYLHELILEEDSEKLDKEILKKINKLNQQEEKLNQQELLLKNEKQEILKFLNQSGPPDNMRNRKKPKTHDYNYNLSILDLQKDKSKLLNIDNGGEAFFFSYP